MGLPGVTYGVIHLVPFGTGQAVYTDVSTQSLFSTVNYGLIQRLPGNIYFINLSFPTRSFNIVIM